MPFPYAYYQDNYTGPIHADSLKAPVLWITPSLVVTSDGIIDVGGKSNLVIDTALSSVTVTGFSGGVDGQVLLIYKPSLSNTFILQHGTGTQNVRMANKQNLTLASSQYGGVMLICRAEGANSYWYEIDTNGFFANGLVGSPSIAFASDSSTGLYLKSSGNVGFTSAGIEKFWYNQTTFNMLVPALFQDGSLLNPGISFINDSDTGFVRTVNGIDISMDATSRVTFHKAGALELQNPNLRSAAVFKLTGTNGTTPQELRISSLLSSDLDTDSILIPTNGIYSKGNVRTAGQFIGTATSALYADLAERYEADAVYPLGTIVKIGGAKEITIADGFNPFGIISANPGFKMNVDAGSDDTHPYVALAGRVPCRVIGLVQKGDSIVLSNVSGVGESGIIGQVVARALEDKLTAEEGLVLVVTRCVI